jgi:hypothetical protein
MQLEGTISHLDVLRCGISNRSMSLVGHSRRIGPLPMLAACPLPSVCDGIAASQKSAAWCQEATYAVQQKHVPDFNLLFDQFVSKSG